MPFKRCAKCKAVRYCSMACQRKHWQQHKTLCATIAELSKTHDENLNAEEQFYKSCLSPREQSKLIRLVGRRCNVKCSLDGIAAEALWDTGAQVSLISQTWLTEHLPNRVMRGVEELLGVTEMDLKTAGGTSLPYLGWVELSFSLCGAAKEDIINVPFLVTSGLLDSPIIGYNVIEEICRRNATDYLVPILSGSLFNANANNIEALVKLVQEERSDTVCTINSGKNDLIIPRGKSLRVSCYAKAGHTLKRIPVLFEAYPSCSLPEGLDIPDSQLTVIKPSSNRVSVG